MTIRTSFLGGTDWTNETLTYVDLNETIAGTQIMLSDSTESSWTDQTSFVTAATINIPDFKIGHAIKVHSFINDTTAINLEIRVQAVVNSTTRTLITKTGIASTTADYEVFIRRLSDANTATLAITERLIVESGTVAFRTTTGSVSTDEWNEVTQIIVQVRNQTTGGTITHRNTRLIHYRDE